MYKIVLLCCMGIASLPLLGMQMEKKITPITTSTQNAAPVIIIEATQDIAPSRHSACAKGCAFLCCCIPATIDVLCYCPLFCRLTPLQKSNESDHDLMKRADENSVHQVEYKMRMKELHGNDACSSLYRKIYLLCCEKAPHHTERCEAECEHLWCFTKALIKFVRE